MECVNAWQSSIVDCVEKMSLWVWSSVCVCVVYCVSDVCGHLNTHR